MYFILPGSRICARLPPAHKLAHGRRFLFAARPTSLKADYRAQRGVKARPKGPLTAEYPAE
jgi:hypothetical protein